MDHEPGGMQPETTALPVEPADPPKRPGHVTAAGIVFIVIGILALLMGLLLAAIGVLGLVAAGTIPDFPFMTDTFDDLATPAFSGVVVMGLVAILIGFLKIKAGRGILRLSAKGRTLGRRLALIFGVLAILGLFSVMGAGEPLAIVGQLVFAGIYLYLFWVLMRYRAAFRPS
jgi:hypothetical protein